MKFRSVIKKKQQFKNVTRNMTKKAVFVRKMRRVYNKKGSYPEGTFFGYESFDEMRKDLLKEFLWYYGKGLKKLRLERC